MIAAYVTQIAFQSESVLTYPPPPDGALTPKARLSTWSEIAGAFLGLNIKDRYEEAETTA